MRPSELLLGRGKLNDVTRREVEHEGPLVVEEGLHGTLTYRHFRSPGFWTTGERQWVRAALVVTRLRLGVFVRGRPVVNVPFADPRFAALTVEVVPRGLRMLVTDCSIFNPRIRGEQDVVVRPADPAWVFAHIDARARLNRS